MNKPENHQNTGFVSANAVAELAGVSRSAVSRTFTDGASVSEATRRKVLAAAEQLGYHVNHLARGLIHEKSKIVSLVTADQHSPYYSRLIQEITQAIQLRNRVALLITIGGDDASAARALRRSLNYRAEATVMLSGTPAASLIQTCLANGQYVILLNRAETPLGTDMIAVDNAAAARDAQKQFLQAGCRRHVIISSTSRTPSLLAREEAYLDAAQKTGLSVEVIRAGPTSYISGAAAARQVLGGANPPDAAFCVTDLIALGFMDAARLEFGLDVPRQLCVIGFDDIEQAGWAAYRLTTYRQPVAEIAAQIAGLLSDGSSQERGQKIMLKAELVQRQTVRQGQPRLWSGPP